MDFISYQNLANSTLIRNIYEDQRLLLTRLTLGIGGESEEICEKVKKYVRDNTDKEELQKSLSKELGDLLWYIATVASTLNLDLNAIAKENIEKLQSRLERGKLTGSGDER